jgi:HSP20 family protein
MPEMEEEEEMARMPLYDMVDKGDRYEIQIELPGIKKDKINLKATEDSIEISAGQSERAEEKREEFIHNERSYRSFYCNIPIPEEIISSKVTTKMNNVILQVVLPKKEPIKLEEEEAKKIKIE